MAISSDKILIGTCGFCKARKDYFKEFKTVEIQRTFYKILEERTLEKWKSEAPEDFVFSVKAFQGVTHPVSSPTWKRSNVKPSGDVGHLKPTREVFKYWELTLKEASILNARFILIQLPKSFKENDVSFENAEEFFSRIDRKDFEVAVELRGWSRKGIRRFVRKFDVIDVTDPLVREPVHGGEENYYRLHGAYVGGKIIYGHKYSDEEISEIAKRIKKLNIGESYVYFNNRYMCEDARRLCELVK